MKLKEYFCGYTVQRYVEHGYHKMEVILQGDFTSLKAIPFTWQGNQGEKEWYGFSCELSSFDPSLFTLAARLLRSVGAHFNRQPQDVLQKLTRLGLGRVVYDCRLHNFVAPKELLPPEQVGWRDNWVALGVPNCRVSAIAASQWEAQAQIEQKLTQMRVGSADDAYLRRWIAAGKPVCRIHDEVRPEVPDLQELLAL